MNIITERQSYFREGFKTDLNKRILEPEEIISGEEGFLYANRKDNRVLTSKMLAFDIVERLGIKASSKVLEVCCGSGQLAFELSKYIAAENIVATDGSKELIDAAINRYSSSGIRFYVENIHRMRIEDQFDCVICKDSFHHFTDSVQAIKELMMPLRSGGTLYIFDLTRAALDEEICTRQEMIKDDHEAMRFLRSINASLTPNEFKAAAIAAGQNTVKVLYPFTYSEENRRLFQIEIGKDLTNEIDMSSLFAVYLIRKA